MPRDLLYRTVSIPVDKAIQKQIVEDALVKEVFFELRNDVEKMALAQYFCELANEFCEEKEEKIFITRKDYETNTAWKSAVDAKYMLKIYSKNNVGTTKIFLLDISKSFFIRVVTT